VGTDNSWRVFFYLGVLTFTDSYRYNVRDLLEALRSYFCIVHSQVENTKVASRLRTRRGNGWLTWPLVDVLIADMADNETKTVGAGKTHETGAFLTIQVNTGVFWYEVPFSQDHEKLVQD
jgi:hypothetical protein